MTAEHARSVLPSNMQMHSGMQCYGEVSERVYHVYPAGESGTNNRHAVGTWLMTADLGSITAKKTYLLIVLCSSYWSSCS